VVEGYLTIIQHHSAIFAMTPLQNNPIPNDIRGFGNLVLGLEYLFM
jgi:hypothetical protein